MSAHDVPTNPSEPADLTLMPDAIYILSDGAFTDRGRTVSWLKAVNLVEDEFEGTKPIVTIHTIGFYSEDDEAEPHTPPGPIRTGQDGLEMPPQVANGQTERAVGCTTAGRCATRP